MPTPRILIEKKRQERKQRSVKGRSADERVRRFSPLVLLWIPVALVVSVGFYFLVLKDRSKNEQMDAKIVKMVPWLGDKQNQPAKPEGEDPAAEENSDSTPTTGVKPLAGAPPLYVSLLSKYDVDNKATFELLVENAGDIEIVTLTLEVDAISAIGKVLGKADAELSNLKVGKSKKTIARFSDVELNNVATWEGRIKLALADQKLPVERQFVFTKQD